jgi:energy-coupling factor transporter ATP-binding protein EcfA2
MKWITEITLNNFRAFGTPETIKIPKGNHLLIYGENGSGKSSIYNALKDFFSSSVTGSTTTYKLNKFLERAGNPAGNVKVSISEIGNNNAAVPFQFSEPATASTNNQNEIILANKFKGFLDYKRMLEVHSLKIPDGQTPNLFKLIVEELLSEHKVADPKGGTTTVEFYKEYKRIKDILQDTESEYSELSKTEIDEKLSEIEEELDDLSEEAAATKDLPERVITRRFELSDEKKLLDDAKKIIDAEQHLNNLNSEFETLLEKIEIIANDFLQNYFKNKIRIQFLYSTLIFNPATDTVDEDISLKIFYSGVEIEFYQAFLNEARLSSLAICIYLASIKTFSPDPANTLKVLYLDDVFIGLDTNNRIPLLNILKKEFIDDNFQIFISTYDRQWFVTARHWFENENCTFKFIELFINDDDGNPTTPDYPVLIDPSENYFERAKSQFACYDFPAAGNYLRKACEAELRRILPKHLTLVVNTKTEAVELIIKLETLIDNFEIFMTKNNLNQVPFQHFKTYKKITFNPLSHDDLEAPHYRNEIRDGIDLVKELQKIKTKEIILAKESATSPMTLGMFQQGTTTPIHNYEIKVLENLQLIQQGTSPVQLSVVKCEIYDGTTRTEFPTMNAAFDQLRIDRGYPASNVYTDFHTNISISTHRKLIAAMTF